IRLGLKGGFQASATGADAVHMQVLLVVLAIAGSTAWLAVDASKRDWTDNGFAKNVPTWVIGSLLLWPIVLLLYVFSHRKKAPLLAAPADVAEPVVEDAKPKKRGFRIPNPELKLPSFGKKKAEAKLAPAAAMSAAEPAEQYGPSLDDVEAEEPVVEIEPEPTPE